MPTFWPCDYQQYCLEFHLMFCVSCSELYNALYAIDCGRAVFGYELTNPTV